MTERPHPDYWLASDGKWYPPETKPGLIPPKKGISNGLLGVLLCSGIAIVALILGAIGYQETEKDKAKEVAGQTFPEVGNEVSKETTTTRRATTTIKAQDAYVERWSEVMCDEYAAACRWSYAETEEFISLACNYLDEIDPYGSKDDDAVIESTAYLITSMVQSGEFSESDGSLIAGAIGATMGGREELC